MILNEEAIMRKITDRMLSGKPYFAHGAVGGFIDNMEMNMNRTQTNAVFTAVVSIIVMGIMVVLTACTENGYEGLVQATKKGDIETVKRLLDSGASANTVDNKHHASLLMWAAHEGHTDMIELLIESGADINANAPNGETALWFAAQKGQLEALKMLVHYNADINVTGWEGATALEVARKNGHQKIVDYLTDAGADG